MNLNQIKRRIGRLVTPKVRFFGGAALLFLFATWLWYSISRHSPSESTSHSAKDDISIDPQSAPTTNPANNGINLYDQTAENADRKWALPAQMDAAALREFTTKLEKLAADFDQYGAHLASLAGNSLALADPSMQSLLYDRIKSQGFRDRQIPLLWHDLASKNAPISFLDTGAEITKDFATNTVAAGIMWRIGTARRDVVAGGPTVGDTLFVNATQTLLDHEIPKVVAQNASMADFLRRFNAEFPDNPVSYWDENDQYHDPLHAQTTTVEVERVRHLMADFQQQRPVLDRLEQLNATRHDAIESLQQKVLQLGDAKFSDAYSAVMQDRQRTGMLALRTPDLLTDEEFQERLMAGKVTLNECRQCDAWFALFKQNVQEAQRERDDALKFADLATQYHLQQELLSATQLNSHECWGDHLQK